MPYLLLGLTLLAGFLLIAWWFSRADTRQVADAARLTAIVLGVILGLYLLFAGRQYLAAILVPLLVLLWRARPLWRRIGSLGGPSAGQRSGVQTPFFAMTLDHETGEVDGEILQGSQTGRRLSTFDLEALVALRREVAGDPQSLALLDAFLDRHFPDWRAAAQGAGGPSTGTGGPMTEEEAYAVLDLAPGASPEEIRSAYRRLMQKLHPDQGGSNWLAAKLNEAKAKLLGE